MMPAEWEPGDNGKENLADWLMKNSEAIVATLLTTPKSRARKPRSDIGKPRKKKAKAVVPAPET